MAVVEQSINLLHCLVHECRVPAHNALEVAKSHDIPYDCRANSDRAPRENTCERTHELLHACCIARPFRALRAPGNLHLSVSEATEEINLVGRETVVLF
jgi:hypothetical protein